MLSSIVQLKYSILFVYVLSFIISINRVSFLVSLYIYRKTKIFPIYVVTVSNVHLKSLRIAILCSCGFLFRFVSCECAARELPMPLHLFIIFSLYSCVSVIVCECVYDSRMWMKCWVNFLMRLLLRYSYIYNLLLVLLNENYFVCLFVWDVQY